MAGKLLPESPFEWGNPGNGFLAGLHGMDSRLAEASSKSREKRCAGVPPPFSGMKVIVHTGENRRISFQRLLELGGAEVLYDAKPPFSNVPGTYLCFVTVFLK